MAIFIGYGLRSAATSVLLLLYLWINVKSVQERHVWRLTQKLPPMPPSTFATTTATLFATHLASAARSGSRDLSRVSIPAALGDDDDNMDSRGVGQQVSASNDSRPELVSPTRYGLLAALLGY
ncbi:hypothetical protein L226DRAFT_570957 [Lentinus tigrinus ALCF2SS1-7]|uniref:uncharacterized protein n=1 Tax=Lentinus tigrinus ALCF2SS1-7 TaxID=1328758 RepID=UPI001165DBEB|nr:hypothetical protein L226DRAFT_570957 [Lentinus tigrinus ALCF2SS1-7]